MISAREAYVSFKKEHPELTVTEAGMYDNQYYLFVAVEDPNVVDYNDPFYVVDKNSGVVRHLNAAMDLDKFFDALENHPIELEKFTGRK